jgi:flagellar hook assembly protein FlgD
VNNNSSEFTIEFVVQSSDEISLSHVLNYPNPFTTRTEFYFEHNQRGQDLEVQVQIFTISGRLVKTINESLLSCGFRSPGIPWDGRDEFGDQLARGTYIYRLSVTLPSGERSEKVEKLVLLR